MKEIVCITCGSYGQPKKKTNGSFLLEIGLWCLFFIPGIIYSIWRISTRYKACSVCGSRSIVPADSPIGQKLLTNK